jgi:RHS repeat-associated protein
MNLPDEEKTPESGCIPVQKKPQYPGLKPGIKDPVYPRPTSITDGTGTTSYSYNPIPASVTTPVTGAGRLATVTGPLANATIAYTYDPLGRQLTRSINGAANLASVHYDSLGRVDTTTNVLGTFSLGYVGATGRLDHVNYPNGQSTHYGYYPNMAAAGSGNGDQRLQQIQNLKSGGANLSTFGYTYDVVGQIQTWSRQNDAATALVSSFQYDPVGQLLTASVPSASSAVKNYTYGYDLAGNRTKEQIDSGVTTATHNPVNQLTGLAPGGAMEFGGTVNEPSTITLAGIPATVDASNNWHGKANVVPGANSIPVVAKDGNGNTTTKTIQVTVPGGATLILTYDLNGNLLDDGAGTITAYDALNRRIKVTVGANVTEYVYNGLGQRVQEKLNGTVIKQWVWGDGAQPVEERNASNVVTKRFFGTGEQIGTVNYYLTTDHLGSVREMTDASGAVRARYDYAPWGQQTKLTGDLESDFGYAGMMRGRSPNEWLTLYRVYRADLARFTTRDPIGEDGGLNLFRYVANNPISFIDLFGLDIWVGSNSFGHQSINVGNPNFPGSSISYTFGLNAANPFTMNPLSGLGLNGVISYDQRSTTPDADLYLHTTKEEDLDAMLILQGLDGIEMQYSPVLGSCRDFSQYMYEYFKARYKKKRC